MNIPEESVAAASPRVAIDVARRSKLPTGSFTSQRNTHEKHRMQDVKKGGTALVAEDESEVLVGQAPVPGISSR